jgi:chaperonin cofactor prefoldin
MAKWDLSKATCSRCEELEAKLAKAVEMLEREIRRVQKIQRDLPPPHKVGLIYVEAEYELMLAELKDKTDD